MGHPVTKLLDLSSHLWTSATSTWFSRKLRVPLGSLRKTGTTRSSCQQSAPLLSEAISHKPSEFPKKCLELNLYPDSGDCSLIRLMRDLAEPGPPGAVLTARAKMEMTL